MLGILHFLGSVGQRREEHGLCGICGKQQPATLAVHYLCPAHSGLCTALLRHKVLSHVVVHLVLVDAQLCAVLTIPEGRVNRDKLIYCFLDGSIILSCDIPALENGSIFFSSKI